jgi:hypothetical protein
VGTLTVYFPFNSILLEPLMATIVTMCANTTQAADIWFEGVDLHGDPHPRY